jgi:hypothetical protein
MKRRKVFSALMALTIVLAGAVTSAVPAQTITKSSGCPSYSGVVCFYDSRNFNNYLGYMPVTACNVRDVLDPFRNRVESVRNRTGCHIYLVYYCGTSRCYQEVMAPHSDDGTIAPLNQIDEAWTYRP